MMTNTDRPITTLFMLSSVDGKISTGATDALDMDKDLPKLFGVCEGLHQYYEIEQTTDLWSLNSGRVQAKIGVNDREMPEKTPVSFVVIDNKNLNENGIRYFAAKSDKFVLVTTNNEHPAYKLRFDNMSIIFQEKLDLKEMLLILKRDFGCERLTVQTGGTINRMFLKEKLFDFVDVVVCPVLVGGKDTPTLIDGDSNTKEEDLSYLGALQLLQAEVLEDSYIRLKYKVI